MNHNLKIAILLINIVVCSILTHAQPVPAIEENIPYLMIFGNNSEKEWGDDDFSQVFFFLIPEGYKQPFYIHTFDPEVGGKHDELNGVFDTQISYEFYGGKTCWSEPDAQKENPFGKYKSGKLISSKTFGQDNKYDDNWYVFGPFNPTEGELVSKFGGYIFKMIIEGVKGDDGNMYRFYISSDITNRISIEGTNAFAYEYSFRMHDNPSQISHIYPYIDDKTISVNQTNFDWDNDGFIRIVSVARKGQIEKVSGDNNWAESSFKIIPDEVNSSLDIQFIKKKQEPVKNNNVVIFVKNQYGELLPFYTIPIGGVPKYKYTIGVKQKE